MSEGLYHKIAESVDFIRNKSSFKPKLGFVLGTGLGDLINDIQITLEVPYADIPNMPTSTVTGHAGRLILGELYGHAVVTLSGRFHYYEGYTMEEVTFGIRLLKALGIERLFLSNVAGGLQADMVPGEIVLVRDHINLQPEHPLRGANDDRIGPRFPDMLNAYDPDINAKALELAKSLNIMARLGVYVSLQGPSLETPAEYKFLHIIGGDVVGMSTVPEVIVARHMDLPVNVFSMVSNVCYPIESLTPTTLEEVLDVAKRGTPKMCALVKELLALLP